MAEQVVATDPTRSEGEGGDAAEYAGRRATIRAACAAMAFATSLYAITRSVHAFGARARVAWMALAAITAGEGLGVLCTLPPLEAATVPTSGWRRASLSKASTHRTELPRLGGDRRVGFAHR